MNIMTKSKIFFAIVRTLLLAGAVLILNMKLIAQTTKNFSSQSEIIASIAFSSSGKYLVGGGSSKTVEVWDLTSNTLLKEMKGHRRNITNVAFSNKENTIASATTSKGGLFSANAELIIWDLESGLPLYNIAAGPYINTLSFNNDGSLLVVGAIDKIQVFSVDTGTKCSEIKTKKVFNFSDFNQENIVSLLIPYEKIGERFVQQSNNFMVKTFNYITGNELNSFVTSNYWEMLVKFCELYDTNISAVPPQIEMLSIEKPKNANLLFILKPNNLIEIWDSMEGLKLATLQKGIIISRMFVEPSGRYLATCGKNNIITLWDLASVPEVASRMATK